MHLALILDGNRRWARAKGLPKSFGHHRGVQNLKKLLPVFIRHGIQIVTTYALSTENLRRDPKELKKLFHELKLFGSDLKPFHAHEIRVRIFGRPEKFPPDVRKVLRILVSATKRYTKLNLNLALAYGGRDELVRAASRLARSRKPFTEKNLSAHLDSAGQSDPDLLIRTGGASRLSNFLPWQLAYAELYFTPKFWPDFDERELMKALAWFREQERNFGK